jgi:NAD(P)-dependent dehydrogenase (short-subunit alcohol dehydrogenase family)
MKSRRRRPINKYKDTIFSLEGKTAIVVGGLGQIGINTVKILLDAGAVVEVLDIVDEADSERAQSLRYEYKDNILFFSKIDITSEESVKEKIFETKKNFGDIDILINHAHYKGDPELLKPHSEFFSSFEDYPFEVWKKTIDVNLNGLFLITKAVGAYMKEQSSGVIVNTSSTYGMVSPNKAIYGDSGINSPVSYAVTKAAILNFSRYLATHWAEHNIRVNTISPGGVDNPSQSDNFKKNYSRLTPLGRLAVDNEYQGAVLYLASDASSYMTGSNLIVDGGWTVW